uniref:HIG1 domain-containing protein n=1 Tax=Heterorhabditis bacteriophora TaxID=37862 RepID=A0A1I7XRI4_HETBA
MSETSRFLPSAPHDFSDHKQHMKWQIERTAHSSVVPLIPKDLSEGSQSSSHSPLLLQKVISNPFIPLGMLATVGCLIGMMSSTLNRNPTRTQFYMRGRCLAQGLTVVSIVCGAAFFGVKPKGMGTQDPSSVIATDTK